MRYVYYYDVEGFSWYRESDETKKRQVVIKEQLKILRKGETIAKPISWLDLLGLERKQCQFIETLHV